jgi:hydroxysqualene synthase
MACQQINNKVDIAYKHCLNIAKKHYENFPVASKILPSNMRKPIAAIYAFARTADDVADEGNLNQEKRLEKLNFLQQQVNIMPDLITEDYVLLALQDTLQKHAIPKNLLIDLLTAFKQDVTKREYATFSEVLEYCKYSANPIGRLLLHLSGNALESNNKLSDKICTGLQLINFLQDVQGDLEYRGRCYIPTVDLNYFSVTVEQLKEGVINPDVNKLFLQQYQRVQNIYMQGINLGNNLKGLFGIEVKMIIAGGKYVLSRLGTRTDPYLRPVLTRLDKLKIFFHATTGKKI